MDLRADIDAVAGINVHLPLLEYIEVTVLPAYFAHNFACKML